MMQAGQEWRATAAQQDSDALLDYVEWLRTDRKTLRQALVAAESANGSSGRAGLTAWDNRAAQGGGSGGVGKFDLALAIELAGFAFETYNPPERGRWEEGTDGVKVAFMSEAFAASCYRGLLTVGAQMLPSYLVVLVYHRSIAHITPRDVIRTHAHLFLSLVML